MAIIDSLKDKIGEIIYPKTLTKAVYEDGTNKRLDDTIGEIGNEIEILSTNLTSHKAEIVSEQIAVTRDLTLTGIQTITTQRKPKKVDIVGIINGTEALCIGNVGFNTQNCVLKSQVGGFLTVTGYGVAMGGDSSNYTRGLISMNADNIEINWSHVGSGGTGTISLRIAIQYHGEG